jgi:hypothetical protein
MHVKGGQRASDRQSAGARCRLPARGLVSAGEANPDTYGASLAPRRSNVTECHPLSRARKTPENPSKPFSRQPRASEAFFGRAQETA